jgi:hypothetical protein
MSVEREAQYAAYSKANDARRRQQRGAAVAELRRLEREADAEANRLKELIHEGKAAAKATAAAAAAAAERDQRKKAVLAAQGTTVAEEGADDYDDQGRLAEVPATHLDTDALADCFAVNPAKKHLAALKGAKGKSPGVPPSPRAKAGEARLLQRCQDLYDRGHDVLRRHHFHSTVSTRLEEVRSRVTKATNAAATVARLQQAGDVEGAGDDPAPGVTVADLVPVVQRSPQCTDDFNHMKRLNTLRGRLGERLAHIQAKAAVLADGDEAEQQALLEEIRSHTSVANVATTTMMLSAVAKHGTASDGAKARGASSAAADRVSMLRQSLDREQQHDDRRRQRQENQRRARMFLRDSREMASQTTLEPEMTVYKHARLVALLSKERALQKAFRSVQLAAANIVAYAENLEVELTCHRCWKPFRDPQILSGCGATICGGCAVELDHRENNDGHGGDDVDGLAVTALDCGCLSHEGMLPNDTVHGACERWIAMDRVTTDLDFSVASLAVALDPAVADADTVSGVEAATAGVKEAVHRLKPVLGARTPGKPPRKESRAARASTASASFTATAS